MSGKFGDVVVDFTGHSSTRTLQKRRQFGPFAVAVTAGDGSGNVDYVHQDVVIQAIEVRPTKSPDSPWTHMARGPYLTMDSALWQLIDSRIADSWVGGLVRFFEDAMAQAVSVATTVNGELVALPVTRKVELTPEHAAWLRRNTGKKVQQVKPTKTAKTQPRPLPMLEEMLRTLVTDVASEGLSESSTKRLLDLREDIALARAAFDRIEGYMEGVEILLLGEDD